MEINRPVASTILLLITAVMVFLFAWPEYRHVKALGITLNEKKATYNGQAIYYGNIAKTLSDIEGRSEVIQRVDNALPEQFALAPLVYFLQKKGTENGLIIKTISFSHNIATASSAEVVSGSAPAKEVKDIMFSLDVFGNYQGLKNFLASLEKSARLFEVEHIAFSSNDGVVSQSSVKTYNFKLEIKTHSY